MNKPLVVITGASSGIGAEAAKVFSTAGYRLALLSRNIEPMEAMRLPHTICLSVDVSDNAALLQAVNRLEDEYGPIDCLINNAGYVKSGEFTEVDIADHHNMIYVNLLAVINTIHAVLPGMQSRKRGTIINISSLSDRKSRPFNATYAATKAGVKSLTESLRMANAKLGIRICNIAPGKVLTPMLIKNKVEDTEHNINALEMANTLLWIYQQPAHICIRDLVISATGYEV